MSSKGANVHWFSRVDLVYPVGFHAAEPRHHQDRGLFVTSVILVISSGMTPAAQRAAPVIFPFWWPAPP